MDIENKLDAVSAAANNGGTNESVDRVFGVVRKDLEVLKDALDEVRQRCAGAGTRRPPEYSS